MSQMIGSGDTRHRLFAAAYARLEPRMAPALAAARQRLVGDLTGDILEVGAGTGATFRYYRPEAHVLATDYSEHMLKRARVEAERAAAAIELRVADARALPFEDATFDAVVVTLVLCSIEQPSRS